MRKPRSKASTARVISIVQRVRAAKFGADRAYALSLIEACAEGYERGKCTETECARWLSEAITALLEISAKGPQSPRKGA